MTRSPSSETDVPLLSTDKPLHGSLGVGGIFFLVVAAAAPLGAVAGSLPIVVMMSQNVAFPVYFGATAVLLTLFAVGYTRLSKYIPGAGAFYSYIQAGLGRVPGSAAATLALGAYMASVCGVYVFIGATGSQLLARTTGTELPWWAFSLVCVALVGVLGALSIDLSSKVLMVFLLAETLVVVVLDVAILANGGEAGLTTSNLDVVGAFSYGNPGLGLIYALLCFVGFEATVVFRSEARRPERTIPRATYVSVLLIAGFYGFSAWAIGVGAGPDVLAQATADPGNLVLALGVHYIGPIFGDVANLLLVVSFFACNLTFHNVLARYAFTMSRNGLLPRAIGAVHRDFKSPAIASSVLSVVIGLTLIVFAVLRADPILMFARLTGLLGLVIPFLMAATSIAAIAYFRRTRVETGVWATIVAPGLAALSLLVTGIFAFANVNVLTGSLASTATAMVLLCVFLGTGVVLALTRRPTRPDPSALLDETTEAEEVLDPALAS